MEGRKERGRMGWSGYPKVKSDRRGEGGTDGHDATAPYVTDAGFR